jgi:iron complex outermembrane receptor protein
MSRSTGDRPSLIGRGAPWIAGVALLLTLDGLPSLAGEADGPAGVADETPPQAAPPLTGLTLEELLNVELTLATRRVQRLFDTAAAVYVVTAEDIRRSGATSLPEALRMVPGLHVARVGSSRWAISARGFTDEFANKLLVLIDGRTVYTPLFAGVYWDSQDVLLEDVERIEVVRGPGASLWGANAVNGIINIVTRSAAATDGTLVTIGGGSSDRVIVGARHAGAFAASGHYRVYAKFFDRASFEDVAGRDARDAWSAFRGGARLEWKSVRDSLELDGSVYAENASWTSTSTTTTPPYSVTGVTHFDVSGGHVLGRFQRELSGGAQLRLQAYYDRTYRGDTLETANEYHEWRDTFDVELQHAIAPQGRHRLLWGLGYRRTSDRIGGEGAFRFQPSARRLDLASAFAQDEIELLQGKARLIVGGKLEHNDFTGFELQPNARLAAFPSERQMAWAAVSRAVRTPSRGDRGVRYVIAAFAGANGMRNEVTYFGSEAFVSEELLAYELGYRAQPSSRLSLDVAAFVNDYDALRTVEPGAPFISTDGSAVVLPQIVRNGASGRTWGVELGAHWVASRWLRVALGYASLRVDVRPYASSLASGAQSDEGTSPSHQLHVRSMADLPANLELDTALYLCGALPARSVPAWSRLDLMLGWRPLDTFELRAGVQDLLGSSQLEYTQAVGGRPPTEIPRAAFARLIWSF